MLSLKHLLLFVICLFPLLGKTQTSLLDSLQKEYRTADNFEDKQHWLSEIVEEHFASGDVVSARPFVDRMHKQATIKKDTFWITLSLRAYGHIADAQNRISDAIDTMIIATKMNEQAGIPDGAAGIRNRLAMIMDVNGRSSEARQLFRKSIEFYKSEKDYEDLAISYNSLGVSYDSDSLYEKAFQAFEMALVYVSKLGEDDDIIAKHPYVYKSVIYAGIGNSHRDLKQFRKATSYFEKALEMAEKYDYVPMESYVLNEVGLMLIELKTTPDYLKNLVDKYGGSEEILNLAYETAKYSGYALDRMDAARSLSLYYANTGNFEKAYERQSEYLSLYEAHFDSLQLKTYADLELKYNTAEQDRQIAENELVIAKGNQERLILYLVLGGAILVLLAIFLVNRRLKRAKAKIEEQKALADQALEEKNLLLKEVHHRVKNNLQVISGLLNKQAMKSTDETVKELMSEGQNRIKSMAMIHQSLYQTEDFRNINMKQYTEELVKSIATTYSVPDQKVDLDLEMKSSNFHIDLAIPLGLILNELLTNVFKYAFTGRKNGLVRIRLEKTNDSDFEMVVSDNGVGLPDDFDQRMSKSLGMNLVKGLCWQLHGKLDYETNAGSTFKVQFKDLATIK